MTTKQKLNLETISGLEIINDQQAESINAGAFFYGTSLDSNELHRANGTSARLDTHVWLEHDTGNGDGIRRSLRLENANPGATARERVLDTQNAFTLTYFNLAGIRIGREEVVAIGSRFIEPPEFTAAVEIDQGIDTEETTNQCPTLFCNIM